MTQRGVKSTSHSPGCLTLWMTALFLSSCMQVSSSAQELRMSHADGSCQWSTAHCLAPFNVAVDRTTSLSFRVNSPVSSAKSNCFCNKSWPPTNCTNMQSESVDGSLFPASITPPQEKQLFQLVQKHVHNGWNGMACVLTQSTLSTFGPRHWFFKCQSPEGQSSMKIEGLWRKSTSMCCCLAHSSKWSLDSECSCLQIIQKLLQVHKLEPSMLNYTNVECSVVQPTWISSGGPTHWFTCHMQVWCCHIHCHFPISHMPSWPSGLLQKQLTGWHSPWDSHLGSQLWLFFALGTAQNHSLSKAQHWKKLKNIEKHCTT